MTCTGRFVATTSLCSTVTVAHETFPWVDHIYRIVLWCLFPGCLVAKYVWSVLFRPWIHDVTCCLYIRSKAFSLVYSHSQQWRQVFVNAEQLALGQHERYITINKPTNRIIGIFYWWLRSGDRGGTVVKVLRYKSEGRWFDSRWCHWNFSLI